MDSLGAVVVVVVAVSAHAMEDMLGMIDDGDAAEKKITMDAKTTDGPSRMSLIKGLGGVET